MLMSILLLVLIPGREFNLAGRRGLAVLVTCNYEGTRARGLPILETDQDADAMTTVFEQFEYDIITLRNEEATKPAIIELVEQLSRYMRGYVGKTHNSNVQTDFKAIVFYFAGHGVDQDRIVTFDGRRLSLERIVRPLVDHVSIFETRHKIPKLFWIDACRGNKVLQHRRRNLSSINGNFHMCYATLQGHVAYDRVWTIVLANMLASRDDDYTKVIMEVNKTASESHLEHPQTLNSLTTGPFKLYYKRPDPPIP